MLGRIKEQVRYRAALRSLLAPAAPDPIYFSRFGGLWTDRHCAGDEIDRRLATGSLTETEAQHLRDWVGNGCVILEGAVEPDVCDALRDGLDGAFEHGDPRLKINLPGVAGYQPLTAGLPTERARVVDVYVYYEAARQALFSAPIANFLHGIFDDPPLLFQSLTFEKGSQQQLHQDSGFVVVSSPVEFASTWVALEDVRPGSGELKYLDGSHRLPEYLFSGKHKHWNAKRDGQEQHAEWHAALRANAQRMGLVEKTFRPRKGDALIWNADLAHRGSPVRDQSLTRKSLVGVYCPRRVAPFYFRVDPRLRATKKFGAGSYASQHYPIGA